MKAVISASRRTDLPAHYARWLGEALAGGEVSFVGPRGGRRTVSLRPEDVHSLVLWSKDYGPLLADGELLRLLIPYHCFFHFSLTGLGDSAIEPGVPSAEAALGQMARLAARWGPERVAWRFDPVVYWWENGELYSNLGLFAELAPRVAALGVRRCIFSFTQWYGKAVSRAARWRFAYVDPPLEAKMEAAARLAAQARELGLELASCAQAAFAALPGIARGRCIDGALLSSLHPEGAEAAGGKDPTQRAECGCTPSVDIGSYTLPCPSACLYCYAQPVRGPGLPRFSFDSSLDSESEWVSEAVTASF